MGSVLSEGDVSSVEMVIEIVKDFTYLGSNLSADGETTREVNCWIARASKAFGSLRMSIFSPIILFLLILKKLFTMQ